MMRGSGKFHVQISHNPSIGGGAVEIWMAREAPDGKFYMIKPMEWTEELLDETAIRNEPTLLLMQRDADEFLQALAQALDTEGIKTPKDATIQGTLEAQKYHLEDLRRLLKLPD